MAQDYGFPGMAVPNQQSWTDQAKPETLSSVLEEAGNHLRTALDNARSFTGKIIGSGIPEGKPDAPEACGVHALAKRIRDLAARLRDETATHHSLVG